MHNATAVQLPRRTPHETVWLSVSGPSDIDDSQEVVRLSLDIGTEDFEFLARLAAYRSALAALQGKKLKRKPTRKSLAESLLAAQCDSMRQQLSEMFAACGEMPPADDAEAMERYVRKVIAWDKRHSGPGR